MSLARAVDLPPPPGPAPQLGPLRFLERRPGATLTRAVFGAGVQLPANASAEDAARAREFVSLAVEGLRAGQL